MMYVTKRNYFGIAIVHLVILSTYQDPFNLAIPLAAKVSQGARETAGTTAR